MLLVVLGAGASYDSLEPLRPQKGHVDEQRPPLAAQLFDDRMPFRMVATRYHESSGLFPRLREAGRQRAIETELDVLQKESEAHPVRARQLAALRFYIRDVIAQATAEWLRDYRLSQINHHALFEQLRFAKASDERVLVVTFNYDTYIEQALDWMGHTIRSLDDYVTGSSFAVFKLHGSLDWSREITFIKSPNREGSPTGGLDAAALIANAPFWKEAASFVMKQTTYEDRRDYVPAIAVPVQSKVDFQCPTRHVQILEQDLPNVDRILTIGWRGQENHFLRLLETHGRQGIRIVCVAEESKAAEEPLAQLRGALRSVSVESKVIGTGFSGLVTSRAVEELFKN